VRTLLIALLIAFPILGDAADDRQMSNWVWELPGERQSFTGLLTDDDFRRVVRELESRRGDDFLDFKSRLPGPIGQGALYPSGAIIGPRRGSQSIEAAEILNSLRMDRYRQDCEKLRHSEMHGTPELYPTQIPWLGSP
jgi:hypothetical protein